MTSARTHIAGTPRGRTRAWRWAAAGRAIAAGALALGFVGYALRASDEVMPTRGADAIVALTGGPERIAEALEQLAAGRGKRLLITGVNRSTNAETLARIVPNNLAWFAC